MADSGNGENLLQSQDFKFTLSGDQAHERLSSQTTKANLRRFKNPAASSDILLFVFTLLEQDKAKAVSQCLVLPSALQAFLSWGV